SPRQAGLFAALLLLTALVAWRNPQFIAPGSLRHLANDAALLGMCALGAALVILVGGIDVSLGALMTLAAAVAGTLWEAGWPWPVALAVAVAVGAAGGALNGALTLLGRVHPIV